LININSKHLFFNFNIFNSDVDSSFNKKCYKKSRDRNIINIAFNKNFDDQDELKTEDRTDKKIYQIIFIIEVKHDDDENNENIDLNKN
jgi:hypothetical protein